MSEIIIPFKSVVDAEAKRVISELKAKLAKAEANAEEWKRQAQRAQSEVDNHKKGIEKLKAFTESLEPITRELMDFLEIYEDEGW